MKQKKELWPVVAKNLKPAITVAIISIPLSIAISIASGAGPAPGIITGFWATIVAGLFGGSHYNVVGPAGALTSILFAVTVGSISGIIGAWILPLLAITSGLIILLVYFVKGEKYLKYIPSSVTYGFASGVAISIAITQIREAFGLTFIQATGEALVDVYHVFQNISAADWMTFTVFFAAFLFLLLWKKFVKTVPGVLPLTVCGALLGFFTRNTELAAHIPTIADRYQNLSFTLFSLPSLSDWGQLLHNPSMLTGILKISVIIAVIGILETLITARVGDKLTNTRFDQNKEVKGLALANMASGVMGGLPATGVFVRTGLNIKSGATHRSAPIITGVLTGLGAVLFFPALKYIPMPIIAAILYMTAIGLIEVSHFKNMWKFARTDFIIATTVGALILVFDAGIAIAVGSAMALILFIEKTSNGNAEVLLNLKGEFVGRTTGNKLRLTTKDFDTVVYSIAGFCSYLDAQRHADRLLRLVKKNKNFHTLILRMRNIHYFDNDAMEALDYVIGELRKKNIRVAVASCSDDLEAALVNNHTFKQFEQLKKENSFFSKSSIAIKYFQEKIAA